ncbi:MAG: hypothetical protein KGD74_10525 [Candidatus Lokiarchaeota archaeon]|nr:hypothetical protein [Candidatus Lokiarchaeota archaeon]
MKANKFFVNKYISLELENGVTNIYVKDKLFRQCKKLVIEIPKKKLKEFLKFSSIDQIPKDYQKNSQVQIKPEIEFLGHCSNLQAWEENDYNS